MLKYYLIIAILLVPNFAHAGKMLKGRLINVKTGDVLEMRIEKVFGSSGKMDVKNESTGELFEGRYTGFRQAAVGSSFGTVYNQNGQPTYGHATGVVSSRTVPAQATLVSAAKSVLTCQFTIQAGFSPHGAGACTDNGNNQYSLEF